MARNNKEEIQLTSSIARIEQKIDDLITETKEIKDKATYTNGKIASALLQINTLETLQNECPAREYHKKGKTSYHLYNILPLIIAAVALVVAFTR
jgi:chromosome segregation ATPase